MALALRQSTDSRPAPPYRRWLSALVQPGPLLLAYITLAVILFARTWVDPTEALTGSGGDPQQVTWTLGWVPFALSHWLNPLFTNYLDYPNGMNLMWTGVSPLLGLLLSPLTLSAGPAIAYNVAATLGPALSAWVAYWAIRRYVRSRGAAAAGGWLYGFSPGIIAQASYGHLHLTFAVFPPLVLILADEILVRRRRAAVLTGALLGLAAGLQLLQAEEILLLTTIAGALGALLLAVLFRTEVRRALPHVARAGATALVVFLGLSAMPLAEQFFGAQRLQGALHPANFYVSDLLNFVVPSSLQAVSPGWISWLSAHFTGDASSRDAYLGLPLIAWSVMVVRRRWQDPLVRWSSLMLLMLAALSLGPALHVAGVVTRIPLPWSILQALPGFENVLPGRFMLLGFLPAGILLAKGLERVGAEPRPGMSVAAALIGLLALLPNPEPALTAPVPAFFQSVAIQRITPGSVVLVAPFAGLYSTDAMAWQAAAGMRFRMPEGYGFLPGGRLSPPPSALQAVMVEVQWEGRSPALTPERLAGLRRELRALGASTVIAGPMAHRDLMVAALTGLLGRPPEWSGGVAVWWDVQDAVAQAAVR